MKHILALLTFLLLVGCSETKIVPQAVKLPNKCGNYDLLYGTLKSDGVLVTIQNQEILMTPIGMTEARVAEPLNIGNNVGQSALVKGIYWGDRLYRAEIVEIVNLSSINISALQEKCNHEDPQIQTPQ